MMDEGNLYCSHCGKTLKRCSCGVDMEIGYRPMGEVFDEGVIGRNAQWIAGAAAIGAVIMLCVVLLS